MSTEPHMVQYIAAFGQLGLAAVGAVLVHWIIRTLIPTLVDLLKTIREECERERAEDREANIAARAAADERHIAARAADADKIGDRLSGLPCVAPPRDVRGRRP